MSKRFTTNHPSAVHLSAAVAAVVSLSACGAVADKIAEEGAERVIEQQSGGDIEFDGDGGFSFDSEDGSIRIGEDGSFIVEGPDGEVYTGQAGEGGFQVQGADGETVLDIDDDDGNVTFEGEDGSGSYRTVSDIPDEWPSDVLAPAGLSAITGTVITGDGQMLITVTGTPGGDAADYVATYGSALETGGYERTSYFESDGGVQAIYEGPTWSVSVIGSNTGQSQVAVSLFPVDG